MARRARRGADATGNVGERRLWLPRRRPFDHAPHLRTRCAAPLRDRRPGRLPRPRRLRPPVHRHATWRPHRRRGVPARRARRVRQVGRQPRRVRQAPRCALQRSRRARGPGRCRGNRRVPVRPDAGRARHASIRHRSGMRAARRAFRPRRLRRPRVHPDGLLVPRTQPGALITDPLRAAAQAVALAASGLQSVCIHSDTPGATDILDAVAHALAAAGVQLQPFAS